MAGIKSLRGLRREQNRLKLVAHDYQVIRHNYNLLQTDQVFQITLNRLSKALDVPIVKLFHRIASTRYMMEVRARSSNLDDKSKLIDPHVVGLLHTDPLHLHPPTVLSSCSMDNVEYTQDNTNVVANQVSQALCPHCNKAVDIVKDIQVSYRSTDIVDNEDW